MGDKNKRVSTEWRGYSPKPDRKLQTPGFPSSPEEMQAEEIRIDEARKELDEAQRRLVLQREWTAKEKESEIFAFTRSGMTQRSPQQEGGRRNSMPDIEFETEGNDRKRSRNTDEVEVIEPSAEEAMKIIRRKLGKIGDGSVEEAKSLATEVEALMNVIQRATERTSPDAKMSRRAFGGEGKAEIATQTPDNRWEEMDTQEGNPMKAGKEYDALLILGDGEQDRKLRGSLLQSYPLMKKFEVEEGPIEIRVQTMVKSGKQQQFDAKTIIVVKRNADGVVTRDILQEVKNILGEGRKLAANFPEGEGADEIRKELWEVFGEKATLFSQPKPKGEAAFNYAEAIKRSGAAPATKQQKSKQKPQQLTAKDFPSLKRKEAVIVKVEVGGSYADTLKMVKEQVAGDGDGWVEATRKTRSGDLLITAKDRLSAVALNQKIGAKVGMTSRMIKKDKTLDIRELEVTTTNEEVERAVRSKLGDELMPEVTLKALRDGPGGTKTVTVVASDRAAFKLATLGRIKVGWANGKIKKREEEKACFRCWEVGHWQRECKGVDRSKLCLNCGKEGHKAADCSEEAHCPVCNVTGHRAKSMKCPKNKETTVVDNKSSGQKPDNV